MESFQSTKALGTANVALWGFYPRILPKNDFALEKANTTFDKSWNSQSTHSSLWFSVRSSFRVSLKKEIKLLEKVFFFISPAPWFDIALQSFKLEVFLSFFTSLSAPWYKFSSSSLVFNSKLALSCSQEDSSRKWNFDRFSEDFH